MSDDSGLVPKKTNDDHKGTEKAVPVITPAHIDRMMADTGIELEVTMRDYLDEFFKSSRITLIASALVALGAGLTFGSIIFNHFPTIDLVIMTICGLAGIIGGITVKRRAAKVEWKEYLAGCAVINEKLSKFKATGASENEFAYPSYITMSCPTREELRTLASFIGKGYWKVTFGWYSGGDINIPVEIDNFFTLDGKNVSYNIWMVRELGENLKKESGMLISEASLIEWMREQRKRPSYQGDADMWLGTKEGCKRMVENRRLARQSAKS